MDKAVQSAGLLMYKMRGNSVEIFLCRPFSIDPARKSHWGIPKGRIDPGENPEDAAKREFFEETGLMPPNVPRYYLGKITYPSGKKEVSVWAFEFDPPKNFQFKSNYTKVKDQNGDSIIIPEIEEWSWFKLKDAGNVIMKSQKEIISRFLRFMGKNNNTYVKKTNGKIDRTFDAEDRLQGISRVGKAF